MPNELLNGNKSRNIFFYLFIFFIIIFLLFYSISLFLHEPLKTEIVPVKFIVGNRLGVDLNVSEANFGIVLLGGRAIRNVIIENTHDFEVLLRLYVSPTIKPYIFANETFVLQPRETKKISLVLVVPDEIAYGNYSGAVTFEFWKK